MGRYVVESRLGVGGMAEVYRARQVGAEGFSRAVALKRVAPSLSEDARFAAMFIAEARIAALLAHPNIVTVLDFDRDEEGALFLAMELVDGPDLRQLAQAARAQGTPLPPGLAAFVAGELLRALAYAHELKHEDKALGIVHRDVSPHNVLVSRGGAVKLTDFGIAKATAAATASTSGTVKGKLAYMPPEQATGEPLDGRADVYAVGVLLYELLAGERPYAGATEAETLARILRGQATPVGARVPSLPPDLATLTMRLMAPRREDRPAGAGEALRELKATRAYPADGEAELARLVKALFPVGTPPTVEAGRRAPAAAGTRSAIGPSRRAVAVLGAVAAVMVVGAVGAWMWPRGRVEEKIANREQGIGNGERSDSDAGPDAGPDAGAEPNPAVGQVAAADAVPDAGRVATSKRPAAKEPGVLTVRAQSWAVVKVDGAVWGQTPINRRALAAGRHRVELANDAQGREETRTVDVKPGEHEVVSVPW